jgi:hypothetical protein
MLFISVNINALLNEAYQQRLRQICLQKYNVCSIFHQTQQYYLSPQVAPKNEINGLKTHNMACSITKHPLPGQIAGRG